MTGRILGMDFGEKRIGLAISDPLGITTQPLEVLVRKSLQDDLGKIHEIIQEYDVKIIAVGLPLNMDGSEGFMVQSVRAFTKALQDKSGPVEIIEVDERLTSLQAGRVLNQASIKGKDKKKRIDSLSAQIILQTHLDSPSH